MSTTHLVRRHLPPAGHPGRHAARGFTLIETMISVAVVGTLSSIALPSVEGHLHKARRADALVAAMQIHLAQERFRGNSTRYGTLAEIGAATVSPAGHYRLEANSNGAGAYELLATAVGAQARDRTCRYLRVQADGPNPVYASGPDATVANADAANRQCWSL